MRSITLVDPSGSPRPVGYAHAAVCEGTVWLAGQISAGPDGQILHPGDLTAQFRQALRNVATALAACDCRPEGVVKLTIYVTDIAAYRQALHPIGHAYRDVFAKHYPAMSVFEVSALFDTQAMVEIEAVAVQGDVVVQRRQSLLDQLPHV